MTVTELVNRCYAQAVISGWAEKEIGIVEQIALLHSEVSEALECFRDHQPMTWTDQAGKPQGVASEYADIVIRLGYYCALNGIDLDAEVERKLAYNATRPHRHGGKEI